ncbi:MAG: hypothetical protein J0I41_10865, partial [Filimonas sp.]|nr:hypothetical protein [Filimonas sp.]
LSPLCGSFLIIIHGYHSAEPPALLRSQVLQSLRFLKQVAGEIGRIPTACQSLCIWEATNV